MSTVIALWANDLRNTIRDRTVNVLLVAPLIFVALLRFGVPEIERHVPALGAYRPLVVGMFCMVAGMFPAFMSSFLMLDEKDQNLFAVFQVLPISSRRFLLYRLVLVAALSFVYPLVIITGSQLIASSLPATLARSLLCAMISPTATLIIVSVAGNKIEGLTLLKGLFFLLALPLVAFVLQSPWTMVFAILPAYWIYAAFSAVDTAAFARALAGAVALHAVVFAVFYARFRRSVFP